MSIGIKITQSMKNEIMEIIDKEGYYNLSSFVREALRTHIRGWRKTWAEETVSGEET